MKTVEVDLSTFMECLRAYIVSARVRASTESELHGYLHGALDKQYGKLVRSEVRLTAADRIDFMVGRIGIELKIKGSLSDVTRQLHRYAQSPDVDALLLVTTRMKLRHMPPTMNGKPVLVAVLIGRMF